LFSRENTLLGVLLLFALITATVQPRFLHWDNIALILSSATILGIVALGEFLVIVRENPPGGFPWTTAR